MAPRVIDNNNKYEEQCTKFDQMRPIIASATMLQNIQINQDKLAHTHNIRQNTTNNNDNTLPSDDSNKVHAMFHITDNEFVPTISVLVHAAIRPKTTPNIQDCFDTNNALRSFWIQTVFEQFD